MNQNKLNISVRLVASNDVSELCKMLNEIIQIGGTTAIEIQLTEEEFRENFLEGDNHLCCHVAVDKSDTLLGFQALEQSPKLPNDWVDIATFARVKPKVAGVGSALFAQSRGYALQSGFVAINATIRADNHGGLMYYDKMGFNTYSVNKAVPLKDGTLIDRVSKQISLL